MNRLAYCTLLAFLLVFIASCDKSEDNKVNFDRSALLSNTADNLIIPRYSLLAMKSGEQLQAVQTFNANPNTTNLSALKTHFLEVYLAWQACSSFEFGPSGMRTLRSIVNTYPVDTSKILQNISNGSYDLASVSNLDAIGLPAMDYLLFGVGSNENAVLNFFQGNTNAQNYLLALSTQMNTEINTVLSEWNGTYKQVFLDADGTDIGSSLGILVNELNLDFEKFIRDGKVGIPLGIRSLGTPQLEKTEAYFSEHSLILIKESMLQLKALFNGTSAQNVNGIGLDDYLNAVKATNSGGDLSDRINIQFDEIIAAINLLNNPLPDEITANEAQVDDVYNKMQQLVVLLKVDLPSNLGILISYQDNDGD